jgi:hypothetical protein
MKNHLILAGATASILALATASAGAQSREIVTTSGPNRQLLHSGMFALGLPYVASVIVAATSDRSEDKNLYIPVAGPWIDLGNRSGCGQVGQASCNTETAYKVLLIGNGILQGVGALEIVGSFLFPETHTLAVAKAEPRVFVTPYYVGTGSYGVSALAQF